MGTTGVLLPITAPPLTHLGRSSSNLARAYCVSARCHIVPLRQRNLRRCLGNSINGDVVNGGGADARANHASIRQRCGLTGHKAGPVQYKLNSACKAWHYVWLLRRQTRNAAPPIPQCRRPLSCSLGCVTKI